MSEEQDPNTPPNENVDPESPEYEATPFLINLPDDPASEKDWYLWAGVLAIFCLVAFWPAISGQFLWDDDHYVSQNMALRSWNGLLHIWKAPIATQQYYPLTYTMFWLEWHIWPTNNPTGYHVINLLLHAGSAVIIWRLLRRLAVPGAWVAAAIWAIHPLQVESVAWISERKNVLSGTLFFASLWFYLKFAGVGREDHPAEPAEIEKNWRAFALSFGLFALGLFAKTVVCSLPVVLLLVLWWKRRRSRSAILGLIPFFILGLALANVTAKMETSPSGMVLATGPAWDIPFSQRLLIAGRGLWFYFDKLVLPTKLTFSYPRVLPDPRDLMQWLPLAGAAAVLIVLAALSRRLGRGPFVAVAFYGVTLFPSLGFANVYPFRYSFVADHFQYLAGLGLIALATAAAAKLFAFAAPRRAAKPAEMGDAPPPLGRAQGAAAILAGFLTIVLAAASWSRAALFNDSVELWKDTLAKNPSSWLAAYNLGVERARQIGRDIDLAKAARVQGDAEGDEAFRKDAEEQADAAKILFKQVLDNPAAPDSEKYLCYNGLGTIELHRADFPGADVIAAYERAAAQFLISIEGERAINLKTDGAFPDATPYLNMGLTELRYAEELERRLPPVVASTLPATRVSTTTMPVTRPATRYAATRFATTRRVIELPQYPATRPANEAEQRVVRKAMESAHYSDQAVNSASGGLRFPRMYEWALANLAKAQFNLGEAHFMMAAVAHRRYDEPEADRQTQAAMAAYYESTKNNDRNADACYQLGLCLASFYDYDKARHYLLRAILLSPNHQNPRAYNAVGEVLAQRAYYTYSMNDMQTAIESFKAALQQQPNFPIARENLERYQQVLSQAEWQPPATQPDTQPQTATPTPPSQ